LCKVDCNPPDNGFKEIEKKGEKGRNFIQGLLKGGEGKWGGERKLVRRSALFWEKDLRIKNATHEKGIGVRNANIEKGVKIRDRKKKKNMQGGKNEKTQHKRKGTRKSLAEKEKKGGILGGIDHHPSRGYERSAQ